MINATITGRLTEDPKVMTTSSGTKWTSFRIASRNMTKNKDGEYGTTFIDCLSFNHAELIEKYCKKGDKIVLAAEITSRTYQTPSGNNITKFEGRVLNVEFSGEGGSKPKAEPKKPEPTFVDEGDDYLPF